MLWIDKYRPKSLETLDLHPEATNTLKCLVSRGGANDVPHLLLYGPSGGGKRTRAMTLLAEQFGPAVYNVRLVQKTIQVNESKSIEITALTSNHHIDINAGDAGNNDKAVIMHLIKEIAQTAPVISAGCSFGFMRPAGSGHSPSGIARPYKVIVLTEADKLTRAAQQALRRTMEKYMASCRMILIANNINRIILPITSRCLAVRVPLPSLPQFTNVIRSVAAAEALAPPPSDSFIQLLYTYSQHNMRRGLLMLEACRTNGVDISQVGSTGSTPNIPLPDWQHYISEIATIIVSEQSPRSLFDLRGKYYEMLAQCIPGDMILKELLLALLMIIPAASRAAIIAAAAKFDIGIKKGSRPIMHLEAFTAQAMLILKGLTLS